MAKLFGCSINVEPDEQVDDGISIAGDLSRSGNQPNGEAMTFSAAFPPFIQREETNPYFRFLDSNSDSESVSMESESDLHHCFIDFFDRESYISSSNQRLSTSRAFNIWEVQDMEEEIELGLQIGSGSGSDDSGGLGLQVPRRMEIDTRRVETDSGRIEIDTGRVEIDWGRVQFDSDRVETDSGRVEIDWGRVEFDSGRVENDSGRVDINSGRVEIDPGLASVAVDHVESENAITWAVSEPVEANLLNEEVVEGISLFLEDEPMDYNQEWHVDLFDVFFEDSLDVAMGPDIFDPPVGVFLPIIDEYAENHEAYEDVLARTFDESGINGSPPASKRVVDELPDVDITSCEELSIGCAICKDEIVVDEKVKRLPCKHYYHKECIVPWLGIRNTCPVCRYELPTDDVEYERNRRRSQRGLARDLMSE